MRLIALTREVSSSLGRCELTHLARAPIDLQRAREQHREYETALAECGCAVARLAAADDMPDSVFIEDAAIVFPELAIITRPGAESRRMETNAVAEALARHRRLRRIDAPATVDGGDVLVVGHRVYVGRSGRTNDAGVEQMKRALAPYGYDLQAVTVRGCVHLKSAVTALGDDLLLMNPAWAPRDPLASFDRIDVHSGEPFAANALRIGDRIVYPASFPRTQERLERHGLRVRTVETSELAKAEGAVTCCSLVFEPES